MAAPVSDLKVLEEKPDDMKTKMELMIMRIQVCVCVCEDNLLVNVEVFFTRQRVREKKRKGEKEKIEGRKNVYGCFKLVLFLVLFTFKYINQPIFNQLVFPG